MSRSKQVGVALCGLALGSLSAHAAITSWSWIIGGVASVEFVSEEIHITGPTGPPPYSVMGDWSGTAQGFLGSVASASMQYSMLTGSLNFAGSVSASRAGGPGADADAFVSFGINFTVDAPTMMSIQGFGTPFVGGAGLRGPGGFNLVYTGDFMESRVLDPAEYQLSVSVDVHPDPGQTIEGTVNLVFEVPSPASALLAPMGAAAAWRRRR